MAETSSLSIRLSTSDLSLVGVPCSLVGCPDDLEWAGLSEHAKDTELHLHATSCELAVQDVLCLELLNSRAPSARLLPSAAAAASNFPDRLAELAGDCLTCGEVLVAKYEALDLIFLPRRPAKPDAGGWFVCVIGNVAAVVYHATLLRRRQVAVILDLDHTVLHASQLASLEAYGPLGWEFNAVEVKGKMVEAGHAKLPALPPKGGSAGGSDDGRYLLSFGNQERFLLQLRPGWERLRAFLTQDPRRFSVTVCTHGRSFYMETVWRVLDPGGALIPQQEWAQRLRCARPDGDDGDIPLKTPLFGTGVASLWDDSLDMRFGPLVIIEDNEEAYDLVHSEHLLVVPMFMQPTGGAPPESGEVLQEVEETLQEFHAHVYGPDGRGGGAADMLLAEAKALAAQLQAPLTDGEHFDSFLAGFESAGRRCWEAMSLEEFLHCKEGPLLPSGPTSLPSSTTSQKKPAAPKFPAAAPRPRKRGRVPQVDADPENPRPGKGVLTEVVPAAAAAPAAAPASTAAGAAVAAATAAAAAALEAAS